MLRQAVEVGIIPVRHELKYNEYVKRAETGGRKNMMVQFFLIYTSSFLPLKRTTLSGQTE